MGSLNPPWNGDQSEEASNAQFQKAMQLTGHECTEALEYYSNVRSASSSCLTMLHRMENELRHCEQLHDICHASNSRAACLLCVAGYCTESGLCKPSWHTLCCLCDYHRLPLVVLHLHLPLLHTCVLVTQGHSLICSSATQLYYSKYNRPSGLESQR